MIDYISSLLSDQTANAICWTIIHSLWQASFVALVMSFYLKRYKKESSVIRYRISVMSLLFVLGFSGCTFLFYYINFGNADIMSVALNSSETVVGLQNYNLDDGTIFSLSHWISEYFYVIASVWILGVLLFALRMFGSLIYLQRVRNSILSEVRPLLNNVLHSVKEHLHIKEAVNIAESKMISTPMVIGFFKPIILFPVGLINQLETEEVEAILIHELTHISRNDYLYNLLISTVELCFYFHPAVWWISANIRSERENCCDDAVILHGKNPAIYAKALYKLESLRQRRIPQLAMPLSNNKNQLLHRIQRIVNQPQNKSQIKEKLVATLLLCIALFGITHSTSKVYNEDVDLIVMNDLDIESEMPKLISIISDIKPIPKLDTIPSSSKTVIIGSDAQKELELHMENGEIKELKVDGKIIDEENYDDHLDQNNSKLILNGDGIAIWDNAHDLNADKFRWLRTEIDSAFDRFHLDHSFKFRNHLNNEKELERLLEKVQRNNNLAERFHEGNRAWILKEDHPGKTRWELAELDSTLKNIHKGHSFRFRNYMLNEDDSSKHVFVFPDGEIFGFDHSKLLGIDIDSLLNKQFEGPHDMVFPHGFHDLDVFDHEELKELLEKNHRIFNFDFDHDSHEAFPFHFDRSRMTMSNRIIEELKMDRLIEDSDKTKIEISGKYFKVNGEKQPKNIHNKYKNIVEEIIGHPLTKDTKIKFESDSTDNSPFPRKKRTRI